MATKRIEKDSKVKLKSKTIPLMFIFTQKVKYVKIDINIDLPGGGPNSLWHRSVVTFILIQCPLSDFKKVNKIWLVHLCLTSGRLVQVSIDKINSTNDWVLSLAIDISTPTIEDDKHFIFFTITIYMYVLQNSMSIYFCPINYDQKRLIELNSFKMEIFTILKRIKFN